LIYNKISGSTINNPTTLLFKEFEKESCYLAFCKDKETWGNCALVNITLPDNTNIVDLMGSVDVATPKKFVDRNTHTLFNEQESTVYIYKIIKGNNTETPENFMKIEWVDVPTLVLQHINSNWCSIKGLPIDYHTVLNESDVYDYYIFSGSLSGDYEVYPSGASRVKINTKNQFNKTVYAEPVRLNCMNGGVETVITTNLKKVTSVLGEISIQGLDETKVAELLPIELATYADSFTSDTPYFTLKNAVKLNNVIYDKMYLMKTRDTVTNNETIWHLDDNNKKYLLFKSSSSFNENFYVKVSVGNTEVGLEIYHESLPFFYDIINSPNNVSDANPPGLEVAYLKNFAVDSSLFEILGYVKIKKTSTSYNSKISYIKELKTISEKDTYIAAGFTTDSSASRRLEMIPITVSTPIFHYSNVVANPVSEDGIYAVGASRIYLDRNNFVVGDEISIKFYDADGVIKTNQSVTVNATSFQENNSYIDISAPIAVALLPDAGSASNKEEATIVSGSTNILSKIEYAVCDKYEDAITFAMENVLIDLSLPNTLGNLYTGVYRQIAICHQPSYVNVGVVPCTNDLYNTNLFDADSNSYPCGSVLFVGNKTPIYRQYISGLETFKLII
jgi:hypothetical protein